MARRLWVVALEEYRAFGKMKIQYLVAEAHGFGDWQWIEPRNAADRPGFLDYTRFKDDADAVAWCLRTQSWLEDKAAEDPATWGCYKIYVREIS